MALFEYNQRLDDAVASLIRSPEFADLSAAEDYLKALDAKTLEILAEASGAPPSTAVVAYYLLMNNRSWINWSFAWHDLEFLLANILTKRGCEGGSVALTEWSALPAALLLATRGWKVFLPPPERHTISEHILREIVPAGEWREATAADLENCFVIGEDRRFIRQEWRRFDYNSFMSAREAWLWTTWSALGAQSSAFLRERHTREFGLVSVLQLPRPRRQRLPIYPAMTGYAKDGGELIRMARIKGRGSGLVQVDQYEALESLFGAPKDGMSVDIPRLEPGKDGSWNLTPAAWLQKESAGAIRSDTTLSHCASIIRCQIIRERPEENVSSSRDPYVAARTVREASMMDLDPVTNFLRADCGYDVVHDLRDPDEIRKYALRKGDILFPFKGSSGSLGRVGFVPAEPEKPTIVSPAICVIRAHPEIDPVWLFWFMNWPATREALVSRAVGGQSLTINIKDLRTLPILKPTQEELDAVLQKHDALLSGMKYMEAIRQGLEADKEKMDALLLKLQKDAV
ncbi:MAG: hypothetical protein K2H64_00640 [Desulfovibrio sp.]|nr:hypothetical protein [Desulfovibrio sp.]